jgi:hypothetical protein
MSGGGGGGSDWRPEPKPVPAPPKKGSAGGGGGGPPDPCNIVEDTNLNSVDRTVLASVGVGAILTVALEVGPPIRLLAKASTTATLGSITSPAMLQIIACIQSGVQYEAEILDIRGAVCSVQIRPL